MPTFSVPLAGTVGSTISVSAVGPCHPGSTVSVSMSSGFETDPTTSKTQIVPGAGTWSVDLAVPALGTGETKETIRAACYDTGDIGYEAQAVPEPGLHAGEHRRQRRARRRESSGTAGQHDVEDDRPDHRGVRRAGEFRRVGHHEVHGYVHVEQRRRDQDGVAQRQQHGTDRGERLATLKRTYTCTVKATNTIGTRRCVFGVTVDRRRRTRASEHPEAHTARGRQVRRGVLEAVGLANKRGPR